MPSVNVGLFGNIDVSFITQETILSISKPSYYAIRAMGPTQKVKAMIFLRMAYECSLYDAKRTVETILASPNVLEETLANDCP